MCIPCALLWFCVSNSFKFFILCSSSGQEPADTTRPSRPPKPAPARPFTISAPPEPPPTYVGGPWDMLGTSAPGYIPASRKRAGDAPGPGASWLPCEAATALLHACSPSQTQSSSTGQGFPGRGQTTSASSLEPLLWTGLVSPGSSSHGWQHALPARPLPEIRWTCRTSTQPLAFKQT